MEVNLKFSYQKEYDPIVKFSNKEKFCQWPFSEINFSNLAFKNIVNDFLLLNVNENIIQFINSNYYKAIRKQSTQ